MKSPTKNRFLYLAGLCLIVALTVSNCFGALTLKQRGLLTQTLDVQNNAKAGDLVSIDAGSFTRRPLGPTLAGWPQGWSAHNSNADARHTFPIAAASGPDLIGEAGAWYYFGPGTAQISGEVELINITNQAGGNEYEGLRMHVGTMSLDLLSLNVFFPDALGIKTVRRNWWVWLGLAWEYNAGAGNWTMKVLYREAGGATQVVYTTGTYSTGGAPNLMTGFRGGTLAPPGSTSKIYARYGLPSLYSMVAMADAAYPAEIAEPVTTMPTFYCRSDATGGALGLVNTAAGAWTPAELIAEAGANKFTLLSGELLDANGAKVDATALSKTTLRTGFKNGTYRFGGSVIYLNDSAGPLRFPSPLVFSSSDYGQLIPDPALGRRVDVRGTTRITNWALDAGNVYTVTFPNTFGVVFEYDSLAEANSITGKPRWLAHPTFANIGAYNGVATAGSFGTDGTTVKLWPTGSGNPNSNGKVYEVTSGDNLLIVQCRGLLIQDLALRDAATTDYFINTNLNAATGDCVKFDGDQLMIANRCDLARGGRHVWALANSSLPNKQRCILLNCTVNDCRPSVYGAGGGQTLGVWDGTANGADNQWSLDNVICSTTNGSVGSTTGVADATDSTLIEHNGGDASYVFSEGEIVNGTVLPGSNVIGFVSTILNIDASAIGSAGIDQHLSAKNVTLTRSRILCRGLPYIGDGAAPGAGTHTIRANVFVCSGAMGTNSTWIGTVNFDGNTVDALAPTGGTTKALATRGGLINLSFRGNVVLFNNGDAYRLFDTLTGGAGDTVSMKQNLLQGSDSARILVTNFDGGTDTLAQLQAGAVDSGSAWNTDLKLGFNREPLYNSQAKGYVNLATVPSLAGTIDQRGRLRAPSGSTEAGANQYLPPPASRLAEK